MILPAKAPAVSFLTSVVMCLRVKVGLMKEMVAHRGLCPAQLY
jgi:hypothetical protein